MYLVQMQVARTHEVHAAAKIFSALTWLRRRMVVQTGFAGSQDDKVRAGRNKCLTKRSVGWAV
jgi:hypothetical protein